MHRSDYRTAISGPTIWSRGTPIRGYSFSLSLPAIFSQSHMCTRTAVLYLRFQHQMSAGLTPPDKHLSQRYLLNHPSSQPYWRKLRFCNLLFAKSQLVQWVPIILMSIWVNCAKERLKKFLCRICTAIMKIATCMVDLITSFMFTLFNYFSSSFENKNAIVMIILTNI